MLLMSFWEKQKSRAKIHDMIRCQSLASCNPMALPVNLVKELLNDSIKSKVETQKWVNDKLDKKFLYGKVPKDSIVIKRFNRVV